MTGLGAIFHSLIMKTPKVTIPNTIRQITVTDDQGNVTLPKSRPKRIISAAPMMSILPAQSIAFSPGIIGVCGEGSFRKNKSTTKTSAPMGTGIDEHFQVTNTCLKLTINPEAPSPAKRDQQGHGTP
jgi:ABC-type Fe3+-hydroxamate transport system substrate-binding protein